MFKKLTSTSGITLVELMVSIAVVLLVTGCISVGIGTVYKAYHNLIFESESDILISEVDTVLEDMLKLSSDAEVDDTESEIVDGVTYYPVTGFVSLETYDGGDDNTYYKYGINGGTVKIEDGKFIYTTDDTETEKVLLISDGMYHNMSVSDFKIQYDNNGHYRFCFKVSSSQVEKTKTSGWYYISSPNVE